MNDTPDNSEKATLRTDWAEDRTSLANERTFAGWMRTSMACIALAIGLKAVFGDFEPTWLAKSVASLFITISLLIFWAAQRQACRTRSRLSANDTEVQSGSAFRSLAILLSLGALATAGVLLAL
jgi:putative membrane protein